MPADKMLTPGEWEALLFQCPDQVRALVYRLAIHHGAVERPLAGYSDGTRQGDG
jgi:hypothetical protein